MAPKKEEKEAAVEQQSVTPEMLGLDNIVAVKENVLPVNGENNERKAPELILSAEEKRILREENLAALSAAQNSMKNHSICKGIVSGVETRGEGEDRIVCLSVPMNRNLKALIPLTKFYQEYPINPGRFDLNTETGRAAYLRSQKQVADKLLGLDVRFIIEDIIPEDENGIVVVMANRTMELAIERKAYWTGESPRIKVNNLYKAKVIQAAPHLVRVALGGYEKNIPEKVLTNRPMNDCRELFRAGDEIPVYITRINIENNEVEAGLDFIIGELLTYRANLDKIQVPERRDDYVDDENTINRGGIQAIAVLTKIVAKTDPEYRNTNVRFYGWVLGYNVPMIVKNVAFNALGTPFKKNDVVNITITGKTSYGYATAYIRHANGSSVVGGNGILPGR